MGKRITTDKQDEFLMSNFADFTNKELASSDILKGLKPIQIEGRAWYLNQYKSSEIRSRARSEGQLGRKHTEETKEKVRKVHLGKKLSQKHKDKISRIRKEKIKNGEIEVPSGYGKSGTREDIGHFVRSRWEANYCRILKKFNIPYQYESRRFIINKFNTTYRPDIYIPELDLYIEIKGYWYPGKKEIFEAFKEEHPEINITVIEKNDYGELERKYSEMIWNWEK